MNTQTQMSFTEATKKYRNITILIVGCGVGLLMMVWATNLITGSLKGSEKEFQLEKLSSERVKIEVQLKETLAKEEEAKKSLETITKEAEKLREERKTTEEQINKVINPSAYKEEGKE